MQKILNSLKRVPIDEVVVGMHLEDVYNNKGTLLLSANMMITSDEQVTKLKKRGVTTVLVNVGKGKDAPCATEPKQISATHSPDPLNKNRTESHRERAYYLELDRAKQMHLQTLETTRETLHAARMGKPVLVTEVEKASEGMVESIMRNPDALVSLAQIKGYDEYTYVHSVNVSIFSTSLAHSMGYDSESLLQIGIGGILHDIGKMQVPDYILNKPGKLTNAEYGVMKKHPVYGLEMVKQRNTISELSKSVIIEHHERYDGTGYPRGLKGDQIREMGLIAAVADVYDAITTDRVYRSAWTPQKALGIIFKGCDREFSRRIVELFTRHLGIYPVGSFIRLNNGEMGVVVRVEKGFLLAPNVLILFSSDQKRLHTPVEYTLSEKQKGEDGESYKISSSLDPKPFGVNISDYIQGKM